MSTRQQTSYAAQHGTAFDWNAFLAREMESFTYEELAKAAKLSKGWVTCACGNQCAIIPRSECHAPWDRELRELGVEFCGEIDRMRKAFLINRNRFNKLRNEARKTLAAIERRAQEIIFEMLKV
jgi:hypothetical protein